MAKLLNPQVSASAALTLITLAARSAMAATSSSSSSSGSGASSSTSSQSGGSNFQQCFCWDQATNNFCNGDKWYNSDACNNWLANNFWWVPVTLLFIIVLLVFPCCFYLSRCCCQCCGGRHSTRGCCCSETSTRATFPGYKNRSIILTKVSFLLLIAAVIPVSITDFVANKKLDHAILTATGAVDAAVTDYTNTFSDAVTAAQSLPTTLVSSDFTANLVSTSSTFNSHASDVHARIHDVNRTESHHVRPLSNIVVAQGLALLFVGLLCCLFSCNRAVGAVMATFSWHLALILLILIPHQISKITVSDACNNYETTMVPLVIGGLTQAGACNNAAVTVGLVGVALNTQNYLTSSDSSFCVDYKRACNAAMQCTTTPCNDWATYQTNNGMKPISQFVWQGNADAAVTQVSDLLKAFDSLKDSVDPGLQQAVQHLMQFRNSDAPALHLILGALANANVNCGAAAQRLESVQFKSAVCGVNGQLHHTSSLLTGLSVLGFVVLFVLVLGMKRFRRLGTYGQNVATEYVPLNVERDVVVAAVCRGSMVGPGEVSGVIVTAPVPPAKQVEYVDARPYGTACYGSTDDAGYRRV